MILLLLAAPSLAAPLLTVRRECDAAGGLPSAKAPLTVSYTTDDPNLGGEVALRTLGATTANTSFAILLSGRVAEVRTYVAIAYDADGTALGKAVVDVDTDTGEVMGLAGAGVSIGKFMSEKDARSSELREELAYTVQVVLEDQVAERAAVVTLTDVTGDGATTEGDAFEQAVSLLALSEKGRGVLSGYTFDDVHGIDSARQTWEGSVALDATADGLTVAFSANADLCLPEGVDAPADGTLTWTETLTLHGSSRSPKWKSVTLGLNEAEVETWRWPFVARVRDDGAEGVSVSLEALFGAANPRAGEVRVRVPAREQLSASAILPAGPGGAATTDPFTVTVHPFGLPSRPLTRFEVLRTADGVTVGTTSYLELNDEKEVLADYDHAKAVYTFADGDGHAAQGGAARWDGDAYALSTVTLSGPEQTDWDGTIEVAVRGEAVWDDLEVTATLGSGEAVTFPLTTLVSVYEGVFVFDADPSGGTYRWGCAGCGEDFGPFEVEARLGSGTRTSAGQASHKAELL